MNTFASVTGIAIPLGTSNVDTDLILPGKYLKTISRTGLGVHAFEALRGTPGNIFDTPLNAGAPILIAGDNFGCGSSREHAAWALKDLGVRVVIAPSFADIFAGNAFKNGILLITLPPEQIDRLLAIGGAVDLTVDLEAQVVATPQGDRFGFDIDPFRKWCLLEGLDEIALTERQTNDIDAFQSQRGRERPWAFPSAQPN